MKRDAWLEYASAEGAEAVSRLFERDPPVLLEVRFPQCGTPPDWHLCRDAEELAEVAAGLAEGAELRLSSVWDLENRRGTLNIRR